MKMQKIPFQKLSSFDLKSRIEDAVGADHFDFKMTAESARSWDRPADTFDGNTGWSQDAGQRDGGWDAAADRGGNRNTVEPTSVTITVDGMERTFGIVLPDDFDPDMSYSAIMTLHGGGNLGTDPAMMARLTGFSDADSPTQFIEVYPQAAGDTWAWRTSDTAIDDIAFIEALVEELTTNWSVDGDNLFAAGISAGGLMVQRLALEVPDLFGGYAVVAANLLASLEDAAIASATDLPMIMFHGSEDRLMPYDGFSGFRGATLMYGSEESADFWAAWNDSAMGEFVALPDSFDDGKAVFMRMSLDESIQQYVVEGGGHAWPGSVQPNATQDIDASQLIITFFDDLGL